MNAGRLKQVLADVSAVLLAAGSKKSADDLRLVAELMKGREHQPVEQFLGELERDLQPMTAEEIAAKHIASLNAANVDDAAFDKAMEVIASDKSVKAADATAIARAYIGGKSTWASKPKALEAIRKEFVARRYEASKMKEVARSRPW